MWMISNLADIRPMGYMGISFHAMVVFGLGKNLLFNSVLGRCGYLDFSNQAKQIWNVLDRGE